MTSVVDEQDQSDFATLRRLAETRFSCRAFLPDPVPEDVIADILDASRWAASWNNIQPWDIVVTRSDTTRQLAEALVEEASSRPEIDSDLPYPPAFEGVYLERRREVGYALYEALGIRRDDWDAREGHRLNNFRFFGAPHVALLTMPRAFGHYGVLDMGGFVATFMLAARARGVATLAQAALAQHSTFIRQRFGIAEGLSFVCGIAFGYADPNHPANGLRTARAAPTEFVRFE